MKKQVKASKWVSVKEMRDIQADTKLVSRLKAGSKAARKKNGRYVPSTRKGWAKSFKKMGQRGDDKLLD